MSVASIMIFQAQLTQWKNDQLLKDELYLGLRKPRTRGKEYDEFIDEFVKSVKKLYPRAYLHL